MRKTITNQTVRLRTAIVGNLQAHRAMDGWELSERDMRQIDAIDVEARLVDSTYTQEDAASTTGCERSSDTPARGR